MPDPNPNPTPAAPTPNRDPAPAPAPATPPAGDPPAPAGVPSPLNENGGGNPNQTDPASPPAAPTGKWADNWREELVGDVTTEEGKKRLTQLQRLDSPRAMYEKLLNQEKLISSGEYKKKLGDNPTPEEMAQYRADNGIPESHDKYDLTLEDGLVIGEQDKPVVDAVLQALHKANAPQGVVSSMLNTYFSMQENAAAERAVQDKEVRNSTTSTLKAEWGSDYIPNINLINAHIATAPEAVQPLLLNARLADGTPLASHPDVLRWMANTARQLNPVATVVPGASDPTGAINSELANLKKMMGDSNSEYWKGPNADRNQQRYRELLEAQNRYGSK